VVVDGGVVVVGRPVSVLVATTLRTGVAVVVVTAVASPSAEVVGVGVSGPRYGCGTGSGAGPTMLDERGPKPTTAVSTSRTPSTANR
jgi:hypothetical protein